MSLDKMLHNKEKNLRVMFSTSYVYFKILIRRIFSVQIPPWLRRGSNPGGRGGRQRD